MASAKVVVVGASVGGVHALGRLVETLPAGFPAPILVVQHVGNFPSILPDILAQRGKLPVAHGSEGEKITDGRVYVAPPDQHMVLEGRRLRLNRGPKEHHSRPAIDPLFVSAALAFGPGAIGVVLTGMLDDGTAGLLAIKRCGGVTVVQDPKDAAYPGMPESALDNLDVDYCVPLADMGRLLEELVRGSPGKGRSIPQDVRAEAEIAERVVGGIGKVEALGGRTPYSCPACGGGLWEVDQPGPPRFRCHTGHSYTAASLLAGQSEKVEESLWVSLRLLEERRNLMLNMARKEKSRRSKKQYADRAEEAAVHAERVRHLLLAPRAG
jgi:two-component system, chemotaxis family, protein-glutamate methylesterase/glutaminase